MKADRFIWVVERANGDFLFAHAKQSAAEFLLHQAPDGCRILKYVPEPQPKRRKRCDTDAFSPA